MTADIDALTRLIEPCVAEQGLALVRVALLGGTSDPTLQVMAERADTRQLNIDDCATLSRALSVVFDALEEQGSDPIEGAYRLEVSSPGIDRPLTRPQDYTDWAGHEARVRMIEPLNGRKQFDGVLVGIEISPSRSREGLGVGTTTFEESPPPTPPASGRGEVNVLLSVPKAGTVHIPLDQIRSAKLLLTDKLIAATAPLSADGADTITEEA